MKKSLLIFILVMCTSVLNAQILQSSKIATRTNVTVAGFCYYKDGNGKEHWVKVADKPSGKQIVNIQKQLLFLGYTVVETGILDVQTKRELALFNKNNDLGNYPYVLPETQTLLKKEYKIKKKALKTSS